MKTNHDKIPTLRPEALPLPWRRLTKTQQAAFADLVGWLAAAVAELPEHPTDRREDARFVGVRPAIRKSRVALLDGQRGTGKTSLLLSLIDATSPRGTSDRSSEDIESDRSVSNGTLQTERIPDHVRGPLDRICRRIVWLEPLDMDTLQAGANLLAAIVARIDKAIGRPDATASHGRFRHASGLLDDTQESEHTWTAFEQLRTDIALAWRRSIAGSDADQFAVDVGRTEAARLALGERLGEILDGFAWQYIRRSDVDNPLFVLPVDDVDLSPNYCLDILQLLRMVATPRLFAIVLGDTTVLDVVTRIALAGEYAQIARRAHQESFVTLPPEDVSAIVASTASSAVRKLLPPAQRTKLQGMRIVQALRYVPAAGEQDLETLLDLRQGPSIRDVIGHPVVTSLSQFILVSPRVRDNVEQSVSSQREERSFPYWGARILEAPPRQVADFWLLLHRIPVVPDEPSAVASADTRPAVRDERTVDIFIELLRDLLQEEHKLTVDQRASILLGFRYDADGRPMFQTDVVMLGREMPAARPIEAGSCTLTVCQVARWELGPWSSRRALREGEFPERPPLLQDRAAAAVMLVHDMLVLDAQGDVLGRPLAATVNDVGGWISLDWPVGIDGAHISWPEPDWLTFREFDLFAAQWGRTARAIVEHVGRVSADMFAKGFLSAIVDTIEAAGTPTYPMKTTGAAATLSNMSWRKLAERVRALLDRSKGEKRTRLLRSLPVTIACILAPEAALFVSDAAGVFSEVLSREWNQPWCKRAIRVARASRARSFYEVGAGDLALRLLAPLEYQRRLRERIQHALNAYHLTFVESVSHARTKVSFSERNLESWPATIEKLLSAFDTRVRDSTRATRRRQKDTLSGRTPDLEETLAFLQDAAEAFGAEFLPSLNHPINDARRALCPRLKDLQPVEKLATTVATR